MRILYIIPGLGSGGGAERSLAAMAPLLTPHLELEVATLSDRDALAPQLKDAGVVVTPISATSRPATVVALRRLVAERQPDLVHTTLWDADVTGRLASIIGRVPVSSSLVNVAYGKCQLASPQLKPSRVRAAQLADMATARGVVRFHALSDVVRQVMSRRLLIPTSRIDVVPRGRDPAEIGAYSSQRRKRMRTELDVGDRPLVVAAARHSWQKGLDTLVRAAPAVLKHAPDAQFVIGGAASDSTPLLETLIRDLGLRESVKLIGRRDDVPDLMCAADAFCMPSRWEGFGAILIEAMALGTPTVATAIGTTLEIQGTDPCFELVPPDSPDRLAEGLLRVLSDRTWRADRGPFARERFLRHYCIDAVADQMLAFFERAVSSSRWSRHHA